MKLYFATILYTVWEAWFAIAGFFIFCNYSRLHSPKSSLRPQSQILRRIVTYPAFVTLIIAFWVDEGTYPEWLQTILSLLAQSLSPVAMLAIGMQLRLRFEQHERVPFGFAVAFKLIIAPLALLMTFKMFDIGGVAAQVCVFEAGMAPMVSSSMMAILAGLQPRFTASVLGYGIVLSFATLPAVYLISTNYL